MKTIEATGKTIEAAVTSGLKELGITLDDAEVKVLQHPGFFSKARVSITALGQVEEKLDTTTPESLISKIEKRAVSAAPQPVQHIGRKNAPANANAQPVQNKQTPDQNKDRQAQQAAPQQNRAAAAQGGMNKPVPPQAKAKEAAAPASATKPDNRQMQQPQQVARQPQPQNRTPQQQQAHNEQPKIDKAALDAAIISSEKYLTNVLKLMSVSGSLKSAVSGDEVNIEIITDNASVIGYRGETLDALEHLVTASSGAEGRIRVNLDSGGFREKRNASLIELAKRLADKAVKTGKKVNLEPMNSLSRKVIHSALSENEQVITRSEGHEPNRYLVIIPKRSGNGNGNANSGGTGNDNRQPGYNKNNRHNKQRGGKPNGGAEPPRA